MKTDWNQTNERMREEDKFSCLKPGACLRWILTQTNEVETTNDDWTLDLLKVHVVKFASVFPHYVTGGNPCYSACHTCHTCYKRWIMGRRGRQTIPVLTIPVLRTDVDGGGTPGRCLEVSRAPPTPPSPHTPLPPPPPRSWLIDLRAGCQGGSGPHRQLGTAIST